MIAMIAVCIPLTVLFFSVLGLSGSSYTKETLIQFQKGGFSYQEKINGIYGPLSLWRWQDIVEIEYKHFPACFEGEVTDFEQHALSIKGEGNTNLDIIVYNSQRDLLLTIQKRWRRHAERQRLPCRRLRRLQSLTRTPASNDR